MKNWFEKIGILEKNFRDELIPTATGILFIIFAVIGWYLMFITGIGEKTILNNYIFLTTIIGLTGFIDDTAGDKKSQGFTGHLKKFTSKELTTGGFKVIISVITVSLVVFRKTTFLFNFLVDVLLILLMTNFLNLLDLRPGRSVKFFIISFIFLMIIRPDLKIYFLPFLILIPYLIFELKGKVMMGDVGSNTLGVMLGYSFSLWPDYTGKVLLTFVLLSLNLLSEKYSFTVFIAENKYLNWLDKLGRK